MKARLTMQHVADAAGFSRMTVSRALKNHPSLPLKTRRHIQRIARKMGYRINPLVSAWMADVRARHPSAQTQVVAFITSLDEEQAWRRNPVFVDYYRSASERGKQMGYRLEHFWYDRRARASQRLSRILYARSIRGAILTGQPNHIQSVHLDWRHLAVVAAGSSFASPRLHTARNHHFDVMWTALRSLRDRGYRRIGLALAESDDLRVNHHWRGSYLAHHDLHPDGPPPSVLWFPEWNASCRDPFLRWLDEERPDAVLTMHTELLDWTRISGRHVPKDMGFALLDLFPLYGPVSGMRQNHERVGAAAMDLVVAQLHRNEYGLPQNPQTTLIFGEWSDGETARKDAKLKRPLAGLGTRSGVTPART